MKKNICFIFCFSFFYLYAFSPGFEFDNINIFLNNDNNKYAPEIISQLNTSAFFNFDFAFNNQSLFFQTGVFFKDEFIQDEFKNKKTIRPFFRRLNYSAFTDYFSFQAGKDLIYFGEGITKNYFYLNIPEMIKSDKTLWHLKFDVPFKKFIFETGAACDTYALDMFEKPKWYSTWAKTSYSSPLFLIGLESDLLFEIQKSKSKQELTLKSSAEIIFNLPLDFKIYSNAQLPTKFFNKKIDDWGILSGVSKTFFTGQTGDDYNFTLIGEASYSGEGVGYGFFYNSGLRDYAGLTAGIQGLENKKLEALMQIELFISDFKFKLIYISKNLLDKKDILNGIFSAAVVLNDL